MRLAIEGTGYQSAVEAFVTGNLIAVDTCDVLSARLAGYAGMAGDDSTAAEFAATYDEAAAESLGVLGELTLGLASLGHLTEASLRNLAWADTVSGPPTLADRAVGVRPAPPPSALGADSSSLPGWANVVLDLLEGVFWPGADTERLRAAGATWRAAATSVGLLSAHCSTALAGLADEVSPEIPIAMATTEDLRARVESLADQLVAIGAACESYADQVEAKRAEMLDLLEDVAIELGVGAVVSGLLSALTAGVATPAAGAAGAARIAAASGRLRAILESLTALTRGTATTLRPVAATLRDSRAYLSRLAAARRMEMTERGSADLGAYRRNWKGLLARFEGPGRGHTLERHVGRPPGWLHDRVLSHPTAKFASSFHDEATADRAVSDILHQRGRDIEAWMEGGRRQLVIESRLDRIVGISVDKAGSTLESRGIRIVLVKDGSMAEGFFVKTAFPKP